MSISPGAGAWLLNPLTAIPDYPGDIEFVPENANALGKGRNEKRAHVFPSLDQRLRAAETLSRKVLPDLKSQELTGKDGGPMAVTLLDFLKELPA